MEGGVAETERLRELCDALATGVYVTGPDGELRYANDAFRRLVGDRSVEAWFAALPDDVQKEARRVWATCRRDGTPYSLLVVGNDRAGAQSWLRWRGLRLADGWCGYWAVRVVEAAIESAHQGKTLSLD